MARFQMPLELQICDDSYYFLQALVYDLCADVYVLLVRRGQKKWAPLCHASGRKLISDNKPVLSDS